MQANARLMILLLLSVSLFAFTGCSDDDDPVAPVPAGTTFTVTIENVSPTYDYFGSGAFDTPVGAGGPGPILPGGAYEVRFGAAPGDKLSFATMMVQSNDLFFAPAGSGIELYAGTTPVSGDVTGQVMLWDAGTEANEEPGLGANQAPRQGGADTGPADGDTTVRLVDDGFTYPAVSDMIEATLTSHGNGEFTLRLENVSTAATLVPSSGPSLPVPMAPGVFAVHSADNPLFVAGAPNPGEGLEALAEDGSAGGLATALAGRTGLASPLAPGVFAVHGSGTPVFTAGAADAGHGLEDVAEDGSAGALAAYLENLAGLSAAGSFAVPVGGAGPGPLLPGSSYRFTVEGRSGDRLSFATMFVQSNDLFFGPADTGLALFDANGMPVTGDITAQVMLWDAGTEANQWPGVGPDQAPRQSGPDTGASDPNPTVRTPSDGYVYPAVAAVVRVTVATE